MFPSDEHDELVPDPVVWRELGICAMTWWRWNRDPRVGLPPPIKIRNRNYRSRRQLEEFKARMIRQAARAPRPAAPAEVEAEA
jgi:hypothetical protein